MKWDGGIKTSPRDSSPDIISGAQMVKGFDIYKDPRKLIPMQSWETFTTDEEKAYNIRAMGGISDTVYGVGSALSNWYGRDWLHRIRVDVSNSLHKATQIPMRLNMSLLPADFWTHINSDASDVRVTTSDGVTEKATFIENLDTAGFKGDLWIDNPVDVGVQTLTTLQQQTGTGTEISFGEGTDFAYAVPVTLTGETINHIRISGSKTGAPGDVSVRLYTNNAGNPGTLVATVATLPSSAFVESVTNVFRDISTILTTNITQSGAHWLVFSVASQSASNYYIFEYSNAGTTTIKSASNIGLTSWTTLGDGTSTPNYTLSFYKNTVTEKYFYIYYGNVEAEKIPHGSPTFNYTYGGRNTFTRTNMRFAYTFGDNLSGNKYFGSTQTTGGDEAFTTDFIYQNALFGKGVKTSNAVIQTDTSDQVAITSDDFSVSFMIYVTEWENVTLLAATSGDITIALNTSGKLLFTVDGSVATTTSTSTLTLTLNEWHIIDCVFDTGHYIYIDGKVEYFNFADGDYDGVATNEGLRVNTGNNVTIAQIWGFDDDITANQVSTKMDNFKRTDFFTVGSEEDFTSISPQYTGIQLYRKTISSGNWKEMTESGSPIKNLLYYPVNAFVDATGTYVVVSSADNNADGFLYLASVKTLSVLNPTHLSLGFSNVAARVAIQPEVAINGTQYFNDFSATLSSVGDPGSANAFTAVSTVQSLASWRTYLAVASVRRNIGFINIWDLASSLSTERVDVGTGNVRVVGTAGDTLFCVVDNFIDDAIKSGNKPTMEIKQYVGNGQMEKTHVIEVPAIIDDSTYLDYWERAVSNFKLFRNEQTLFYARIPKTSAGDTFSEGFWSVGKNSDGMLSLALMIDTEGLGMPENVFGFAQQVFFVQKDGGIKRLSDSTYGNIALYTTEKMNEGNSQIEKKLHGIEIITEPLVTGQTISIYYKKNGEDTRTKICDFTGVNSIAYEALYDINGTALGNYKEIEFDIESTGGSASLLEFNYKYEYLKNIV